MKTPGEAFAADVTTTSTGKKYLDLSTYDVKSRQGARQWAEANGVTPVTKEQSNALIGIDTARRRISLSLKQLSAPPASLGASRSDRRPDEYEDVEDES